MQPVISSSLTGKVLWELGGRRNSFKDLSDGATTKLTWQHHATWHENNTIAIFDNGACDKFATVDYSRALLITLDMDEMTAKLIQDYVAPQRLLVHSHGSINYYLIVGISWLYGVIQRRTRNICPMAKSCVRFSWAL